MKETGDCEHGIMKLLCSAAHLSDAPALMAQRIVKRLIKESFVPISPHCPVRFHAQMADLIADELHQCALEGTLGGKP